MFLNVTKSRPLYYWLLNFFLFIFNQSEHDFKPQERSEFVCDLTNHVVAAWMLTVGTHNFNCLKLHSHFADLNDTANEQQKWFELSTDRLNGHLSYMHSNGIRIALSQGWNFFITEWIQSCSVVCWYLSNIYNWLKNYFCSCNTVVALELGCPHCVEIILWTKIQFWASVQIPQSS